MATHSPARVRIPTVVGLGVAEALVIAGVLRTHLPEITARSRSTVLTGHHQGGHSGTAAPIVDAVIPHFAGLAALSAHLMVIALIAVLHRFRVRSVLGLSIAAAVTSAVTAVVVERLTLAGAFTAGETVALSTEVLRWTFLLALGAGAVFGVPWETRKVAAC
ncbi:hypothetical protein Lesp02_43690 [Lentzea sp. NBRC 105346]|uniref:hypothetical protein n=1 Tax=Lentzea sp. NBRC 105346 TaxID=3032205 RepID=UPI0024A5F464|nr:hypothetical protein [Lentzea sp. NBRC 105346]GLZ32181.1 hypothetical protein Lesp02_43690 [Lentzea sp. NBRC 105346]